MAQQGILVSACLLGVSCKYNGASNENENVAKLLDEYRVIPVCPEQLGGLTTPRAPSERKGHKVVTDTGADVTAQYAKGALEALRIAKKFHCSCALLKERSPSCGFGEIYDGSFSHQLTEGDGVTAELLDAYGIPVFGESRIVEMLTFLSNQNK